MNIASERTIAVLRAVACLDGPVDRASISRQTTLEPAKIHKVLIPLIAHGHIHEKTTGRPGRNGPLYSYKPAASGIAMLKQVPLPFIPAHTSYQTLANLLSHHHNHQLTWTPADDDTELLTTALTTAVQHFDYAEACPQDDAPILTVLRQGSSTRTILRHITGMTLHDISLSLRILAGRGRITLTDIPAETEQHIWDYPGDTLITITAQGREALRRHERLVASPQAYRSLREALQTLTQNQTITPSTELIEALRAMPDEAATAG